MITQPPRRSNRSSSLARENPLHGGAGRNAVSLKEFEKPVEEDSESPASRVPAAKTMEPGHAQKGIRLIDDIEIFVRSGPITTATFQRELRRQCPSLPTDVVDEIVAKFSLNVLRNTLRQGIANEKATSQVARQLLRYASRRRTPCYDRTHPHHGLCRDPTRCVVPKHAHDGRWGGQRYVPPWLETLAKKIDQLPTSSGTQRQCQIIVLQTGPAAHEDGRSNEDMIACARSFSRRHGFRWDHLFCLKDSRRKRDHRIIKLRRNEYLLEVRVELVPAGTLAGTLPYRRSKDSTRKAFHAPSVWQMSSPLPTWTIRWVFVYYGEPLTPDSISRLVKRWIKHPRNRGRSSVSCSCESMESPSTALNQLQLYRTACLQLPGPKRAEVEAMRRGCGLRRVFRLGMARGQLKIAKKLWKQALVMTDQHMFASAVSQADWARMIVGARDWAKAMSRLPRRSDRELALEFRWKHRREVVYPKLLRHHLLGEEAPLVPASRQKEHSMTDLTHNDRETVTTQIGELARIVRSQHAEHMHQLTKIKVQIRTLCRDLAAGRISRTQFNDAHKQLEQTLSKWPRRSASVQ